MFELITMKIGNYFWCLYANTLYVVQLWHWVFSDFFLELDLLSFFKFYFKKLLIYCLIVVNHILDFADYLFDFFNYDKFLISYILYFCLVFLYYIQKCFRYFFWWGYYNMFFNVYPSVHLRTNIFFFLINKRSFYNVKYILRRKTDWSYEDSVIKIRFLNSLDSVETRAIYNRLSKYVVLLNSRKDLQESYYSEELSIIQKQTFASVSILNDLQHFYRSDGFYVANWMYKYRFKDLYNFYKQCVYNRQIFAHSNILFFKRVKISWLNFVKNLINLNTDESFKLRNYVFLHLKIKLEDLLVFSNVNLNTVEALDLIFFNLNLYNQNDQMYHTFKILDFKQLQIDIHKLSKYYDSLYVLDTIISSYVLGVDALIKCELDMITYNLAVTTSKEIKASRTYSDLSTNINNLFINYIKTPFTEFFLSFIFNLFISKQPDLFFYCKKKIKKIRKNQSFSISKIFNFRNKLIQLWESELPDK